MEAIVRPRSEERILPPVGPLVVRVAQFMVDRREVLARRLDAHLDPAILVVVDVPGARVADDVAVRRLHEQRALPEGIGQRVEPEGTEESLAVADHFDRVDILTLQLSCQVNPRTDVVGCHQIDDIAPTLCPHVAEQVRGNGTVRGHDRRSVGIAEFRADQAVKGFVQRTNLIPEPVEFAPEGIGWHVIRRTPHRARIVEAEFNRSGVGNLDEPFVAAP